MLAERHINPEIKSKLPNKQGRGFKIITKKRVENAQASSRKGKRKRPTGAAIEKGSTKVRDCDKGQRTVRGLG